MAKSTGRKAEPKKDDLERARRKLAKLALKLEVAAEEQLQADVRGKQEIEHARLLAAQWQTKAAEKIERRRQQVARAEARVAELAGLEPAADRQPAANSASPGTTRADRALQALRAMDGGGATLAQWSKAAGMSKSTLSRARNELAERGLIAQDGLEGTAARYVPLRPN